MNIEALDYKQHANTDQEWTISDCAFGNLNLIVGPNASGKTRTLNVLKGLAELVSGRKKLEYTSGDYDIRFSRAEDRYRYVLHYEDSEVLEEKLEINDQVRLDRGDGGRGRIFAEALSKADGSVLGFMDFQTPTNELACVTRRDELQHPFFAPLHDWGDTLRHYPFSTDMGRTVMLVKVEDESRKERIREAQAALQVFHAGQEEYGEEFTQRIMALMNRIGYQVERVWLEESSRVRIEQTGQHPLWLQIQEGDLPGPTSQIEVSAGMFRALSLLIHLTFSALSGASGTVLIDDIGEGLDFERSRSLIQVVLELAKESNVQLIMTTNDRFVMNAIPLQHWMLIRRIAGHVRFVTKKNSPEVFERFELTGLSNFDMFATGFIDQIENP